MKYKTMIIIIIIATFHENAWHTPMHAKFSPEFIAFMKMTTVANFRLFTWSDGQYRRFRNDQYRANLSRSCERYNFGKFAWAFVVRTRASIIKVCFYEKHNHRIRVINASLWQGYKRNSREREAGTQMTQRHASSRCIHVERDSSSRSLYRKMRRRGDRPSFW